MSASREPGGISLPRWTVLVAGGVAAWVVWTVWKQHDGDETRVRDALRDPDAPAVARIQAAEALGRLGAAAVPELLEALDEEHPTVRRTAAFALSRIGPDGREAAPRLHRLLDDSDAATRHAAIHALTRVLPGDAMTIAALERLLQDPSPLVREFVVEALTEAGPAAVPSFARVIDAKEPALRRVAVRALQKLAQEEEDAVPPLRRALADESARVRFAAYEALASVSGLTVPEIRRGLGDENPYIVGVCAWALSSMGSEGAAAVPELVEILENHSQHRLPVAVALKSIGPAADAAVPELLRIAEAPLDDSSRERRAGDETVRVHVIEALVAIAPDHERLVPLLQELLAGPHGYVCYGAAAGLRQIDPDLAREAVPALAERLQSDDLRERWAAVAALNALGPEATAAVPVLVIALKDEDSFVRSRAVSVLRQIGPAAGPAVPALVDMVRADRDAEAIAALQAVGSEAQSAIPVLIEAHRDAPTAESSFAALRALGTLGRGDHRVEEVFTSAARHEHPRVRWWGLLTLAESVEDADRVVPHLIRGLEDEHPYVRLAAVRGLARFGDDSRAILGLTASLQDPHAYVRTGAAQGLGEIGPDARRALPRLTAIVNDRRSGVPNTVAVQEVRMTVGYWLDFYREVRGLTLRDVAADALARIEADIPRPGD